MANRVEIINPLPGGNHWMGHRNADRYARQGRGEFIGTSRKQFRFFTRHRLHQAAADNWEQKIRPSAPDTEYSREMAARAAMVHAEDAAARRKRVADAQGSHTSEEWRWILKKYGNRCLRCGIRAKDTYFGRLEKDHICPLAEGGTNYASNLQPLCKRCNVWKGAREIDFRNSWVNEQYGSGSTSVGPESVRPS